jgi:predicted transposase YbfD/YdcC
LLGHVIDIEEFEQRVREYFARQAHAGRSITIALDGKTLRGTIRAGQSQGRHLLAAYLPQEGWVLLPVEVGNKANEIVAAPQLLKSLDLQDKIITGDAMLAQRELSLQIVEAGGDYVWTVKDNQPQLLTDIQTLFAPESVVKGFSPASQDDFRRGQTIGKAHGRLEQRTLTASSALQGYVDWPYAAQVFKLERRFERMRDRHTMTEVVYGVTSLKAAQATPARLLALVRGHWQIENGLHYRRDETLREDWCHLRVGESPRAMAVINNLVVGLLLRQGRKNLPEARRYYDAHPNDARQLLLTRPD